MGDQEMLDKASELAELVFRYFEKETSHISDGGEPSSIPSKEGGLPKHMVEIAKDLGIIVAQAAVQEVTSKGIEVTRPAEGSVRFRGFKIQELINQLMYLAVISRMCFDLDGALIWRGITHQLTVMLYDTFIESKQWCLFGEHRDPDNIPSEFLGLHNEITKASKKSIEDLGGSDKAWATLNRGYLKYPNDLKVVTAQRDAIVDSLQEALSDLTQNVTEEGKL